MLNLPIVGFNLFLFMAINWQIGTVTQIKQETKKVKSFTISLPNWKPHKPGQHYDLRLTAEDGYQTIRKYSIGSAPEQENEVELTIDLLDDGEVSAYMHEVVVPGDRLELRGPIGGYFVWHAKLNTHILLIAGGSGVVPLMSMLRHKQKANSLTKMVLLYSIKTEEDIIYHEELNHLGQFSDISIYYTFTRAIPKGWMGYQARINGGMLQDMLRLFHERPLVYVCGPTSMVEYVAHELVSKGIPGAKIRTERFGPSGSS